MLLFSADIYGGEFKYIFPPPDQILLMRQQRTVKLLVLKYEEC